MRVFGYADLNPLKSQKEEKKYSCESNPFLLELRKHQAQVKALTERRALEAASKLASGKSGDENSTSSEIILKPDGSRVLIVTVRMGDQVINHTIRLTEPNEFASPPGVAEILGDMLGVEK